MSEQGASPASPGPDSAGGLYCKIGGLEAPVRPEDLSRAGLFVQTTTPLPLDAEVEIYLRSPIGQIIVRGQVVQIISTAEARRQGRSAGCGLLFTHLSKMHQRWIERALASVEPARPAAHAAFEVQAPPRRPAVEEAAQPRAPRPTPPAVEIPRAVEVVPPPRPVAPATAAKANKAEPRLDREQAAILLYLEQELEKISKQEPWEILELTRGADAVTARAAYLRLSKRRHPHVYARYNSDRISRAVTQLFISTKRAYAAVSRSLVEGSTSTTMGAAVVTPEATPEADTPQTVAAAIEHAREHLEALHFRKAKQALRRALELEPQSVPAQVWLGVAEARELKALGRHARARARYRAVLALDPNHDEANEQANAVGAARPVPPDPRNGRGRGR